MPPPTLEAVSDFTGGGIDELPESAHSTGDRDFDRRIQDLVRDWGGGNSPELIEEMILSALKMGSDGLGKADLKLFSRSLKELRYAAKVFSPYEDRRKVVVYGSARTPYIEPVALAAEAFARALRELDYMIITGAGDGIMGAAQKGAGMEHSFGLNIKLPFEQRANEYIHGDAKLISFNYFFTRKLNFMKEAHAIALFPGGFGTMDESFEALTLMQTGKARVLPIVLLDQPGGKYWETWLSFLRDFLLKRNLVGPDDFHLFKICPDVNEAVTEIRTFYRRFHSYRWVRQRLVIRLTEKPTQAAVDELTEEFSDLLIEGSIFRTAALREERNTPELNHLPRVVLTPHRHNFGRLRQLIDALNQAETEL